jgi:CheY-like chemotaxis protein
MSHELRTPLNSITILSNLLAENPDKNLTPAQVEYARTIQSSGRDLLTLINQILDLSKIEAGRMEVQRNLVPLAEVAEHAERTFRPVAREKNLEFNVTVDPDVPTVITTDGQRLRQILTNLLSNAFKFTETGAVEMRVTMEENRAVAFTISDTGIGIPPDKQEIIFEAFQQVDASTSREYGGTGLGLTISRELARLLGGEIHVRSTPGHGSTFTLRVPVTPPEREPILALPNSPVLAPSRSPELPAGATTPEPTHTKPLPGLAGQRVLAVDDDVRNLFAVTSLLERYGLEVLAASNADEAFAVLAREPGVSLVLMDMMMPGTDGYEATRRLRADPKLRHLPVIALTAKAMPGDREKAIAAGCDDFVSKPVDRDALVRVIIKWLDAQHRSDMTARA